jgi:hypothetical protein
MTPLPNAETAHTTEDHLQLAKRAADRGDVSHTVLHSQAALILAVETLAGELRALRKQSLAA